MNEIEVKILEINPAEIRKKLKQAGAKRVFGGTIGARYYDFSDRRIRKAGNVLRLRKFGKKIELTFKNIKGKKKYKHADETDVIIEDFEAMHRFLTSIGLKHYAALRKKRERYQIKGLKFEIDKYPGIPYYVEVEAKTKKDTKKAKLLLEKGVRLIGYKMSDTKPWNAFEVHKYYHKKI
jgi:adenylate cyclase class 2